MPNLFTYASKELSQDAMICWLLEWSAVTARNEPDRGLRDLGRMFVEVLLGKHCVHLQGAIEYAEILQQDSGIDVLARVRDGRSAHVLLIEDKTNTDAHSNQLHRYRKAVSDGNTALGRVPQHWPIYLKTGNQSLSSDLRVENAGFRVFRREDFLKVLNDYRGSHPVVTDFREHLQQLEDDFKGFGAWRRVDSRENWSWAAWEGFYRRLECELETEDRHCMDWGYVPNKTGGFLAFYWFPVNAGSNTTFYLQLEIAPGNPEKQKLCFKVEPGKSDADKYAVDFYRLLRDISGDELIERPRRFGRRGSKTMTVGWWKGEWLAFDADGRLHFNSTAQNFRRASRIVKAVHNGLPREGPQEIG